MEKIFVSKLSIVNDDNATKNWCASERDYHNSGEINLESKVNDFRVKNLHFNKSDQLKHSNNELTKHGAQPFFLSSTGDPYQDSEKLANNIDDNVLPEAKHPLVAACPEIIINLEQVIISKNMTSGIEESKNQATETTKTVTSSTTNGHTLGQSSQISNSKTFSNLEVDVSTSFSYNHESSNVVTLDKAQTHTSSQTTSETWTQTLNLDTARTAFLNTNLRYQNIGTAPIYKFQPTLSFVLGNDETAETVATITAQSNSIANVLLPNQSYPDLAQHPLAFHASDDFNWQSILLNFEQVEKLNKGTKLQMQTTQFQGNFGIKNVDNQLISIDDSWNSVLSNVYGQTACITITLKDGTLQRRRVAARRVENYDQQTLQELTLHEAIKIAFPTIIVDKTVEKIGLKNDQMFVIKYRVDDNTHQQIVQQKNIFNFNSMLDLKLTQGMNIWISQSN